MLAGQGEALVTHQFSLRLLLLFICSIHGAAASAEFGPGEAAARSQSVRADFKVLFWYRHGDPLTTFKYVIYDLRKNSRSPYPILCPIPKA
jgi:hypothetical protein